jgi:transcriptional regulator with XRE-family HTH domain
MNRMRISQSRLARVIGVDHSYVCRLQSGERQPSRDTAEKIAAALMLNRTDEIDLLASAGFLGTGMAVVTHPALGELDRLMRHPNLPEKARLAAALQIAGVSGTLEILLNGVES